MRLLRTQRVRLTLIVDKTMRPILSFFVASCLLSVGCSKPRDRVYRLKSLSHAVNDVEVRGDNVAVVTDELARRYAIKVGFDLTTAFDRRPVSIRVPAGTVADVLDKIIVEAPDYKWVEDDGVINV